MSALQALIKRNKKMIINGNAILSDIIDLSNKGYVKGLRMPFKCLDELYSMKMGHTSYIVGHEYNGKTEFVLERDVYLAKNFGIKTAIFTPETGSVEDIYLEIAHKWSGKSLIGNYVSMGEKQSILYQVCSHFFVINADDEEISMLEIFESLLEFEAENAVFIENIVIDPFNEIKFDLQGMPRDIWLEKQLGSVRRKVRKEQRHITIVTHPIESDRLYHPDGYTLPPSRKQYSGGQAWARKGESMMAVWRPPFGTNHKGEEFKDSDGIPFSDNECHIIIHKSKPKGTGQLGVGVLYFDWQRSAYFELIAGHRFYAGEYYAKHENTQVKIIPIESDPF